jgi:hypothetical protein
VTGSLFQDAELRVLLVEADAYISHMLYRGSWPGERQDVERLIGRLRNASKPAVELWINNGRFAGEAVKPHMTGAEIRYLPNPPVSTDDDLFVEVPGNQDLLVSPQEVVEVTGKRFFSVPRFINAG